MDDEYQMRKDVDRIYDDLYDYQRLKPNVCPTNKLLQYLSQTYYDIGQIDEIVSDIISGDIDLTDYVKKSDLIDETKYDIDLNLSFGTKGFDDTITIDMDIVDYVVSKIINIGDE